MALFGELSKLSRRGLFASLGWFFLIAVWTAIVSRPVENLVKDVMMTTISPFKTPYSGIVIVAVTEQTLEQFPYRSPLDRGFLADLVRRITQAHPRAIGIDLLFDQPTESDKDARLAAVLDATEVPVVISSGSSVDDLTDKQVYFLDTFARRSGRGLVALSHDRLDGVVRETFPGRQVGGAWVPSFSGALAASVGIEGSRERGAMVYYRSLEATPAKFTEYPAHSAILAPLSWFAGKFVLIGVDLPLQDRHATPFAALNGSNAGALPGVVIHAHNLSRLLNGDRIVSFGLLHAILASVPVGIFSLWIAWRRMPVMVKPILVIGAVLLIWMGKLAAFAWFAVDFPLVAPTMVLLGMAAYVGVLAWQRDARERKFVQTAFSRYLNPAVVDEIIREPSMLKLGGSKRLITCVFTDLDGFTSFSEKVSPEMLGSVLNGYLDELCSLFVDHGATIDKIIGDAVIGFFGAPRDQEDQSVRAVALALAIQERSRRFRHAIAANGQVIGATRIGVHAGPAIVGNFGGNRFFNYTAMGDTVNTAARLEGANKIIGTSNCISGEVTRLAEGHLLRPSGALYLKGKHHCIHAFEALQETETNRALAEEYTSAYRQMAQGQPTARAAFESLAAHYPKDRLIAFHLARLVQGDVGAALYLAEK